jgi:phosphoglycolate phosphatase
LVYQAVLFDLDGTLINTLNDLADSVNESLNQLGFPQHERNLYKQFISAGMETMAMRALPEDKRSTSTVKKLVAYIQREYSARWAKNALPYPGISELLDALVRLNIRMAVLSNNPHNFTQLIVCRLLGKWHFEAVVGARPSVPKKPNPSAAFQIVQKLNILPTHFLYLGDSDIDMKTAIAAGMYPVGALWGFSGIDELLAGGASKLIRHPIDLLKLL